MTEKRQPWSKFYWGDWRKDIPLRTCSYAARGLWADLLSMMAESERPGYLLVNEASPTPKQLSGLLGGAAREIEELIGELDEVKVFSRIGGPIPSDLQGIVDETLPVGTIYSRRALRDKAKAEKDRANGKGGGNPNLKGRVNPPSNPPDNDPDKAQKPEARGQRPEEKPAAVIPASAPEPPTAPAEPAPPPKAAAAQDEVRKRIEVGDRVLEAAGHDPARWTGDYGIVSVWLAEGFDVELDILAAVRQVAKRPGYKPPGSLKYFTGAIQRAYEDRHFALGKFDRTNGQAEAPGIKVSEPTEAELEGRARGIRSDHAKLKELGGDEVADREIILRWGRLAYTALPHLKQEGQAA